MEGRVRTPVIEKRVEPFHQCHATAQAPGPDGRASCEAQSTMPTLLPEPWVRTSTYSLPVAPQRAPVPAPTLVPYVM
ncbi:hypothetical protein Micau_0643 [Micromonospora aurantiaca ATCC 27029]|nr:hypothetical protein Micau_0643 [Micromonospora aurantiaca ATCC 27029]